MHVYFLIFGARSRSGQCCCPGCHQLVFWSGCLRQVGPNRICILQFSPYRLSGRILRRILRHSSIWYDGETCCCEARSTKRACVNEIEQCKSRPGFLNTMVLNIWVSTSIQLLIPVCSLGQFIVVLNSLIALSDAGVMAWYISHLPELLS